jgi:hypothetical protein
MRMGRNYYPFDRLEQDFNRGALLFNGLLDLEKWAIRSVQPFF